MSEPKLIRVEVYPNPLTSTLAGDYLVPVYETIQADAQGRVGYTEVRGTPLYLSKLDTPGMTPEIHLAALAMVDAERRFGPIVQAFFTGKYPR